MQEKFRQLADAAPEPGHMAGDGRRDAVTVLGHARTELAQDYVSLTIEPAVTSCGVAAGEVSEKDQISRRPRELREALPRGVGACDCLWLG
jgi:hypothetical protein